jgi:type 1 glutamine amidotransferase
MVRYALAAAALTVITFMVLNVEVSDGSEMGEPQIEETTTTTVPVTTTTTIDLSFLNTTTTTTVKKSVQKPVQNNDPGDGSRWDQLAQCEAGGNWATNTGNGFGGGLQFMHQSSYSTWLSFGGGEYAAHPWEASREQQIMIAEKVLASSGWKAWPGCSRKFGWL